MKILYGTTNQAKLNDMKQILFGLDIEIIGLNEINIKVESIDETGNNPLENAKIKALAYYEAIRMPVFSCDSGLYIEGLEKDKQPGVHVRRINGKELNDEEMINFYANVAFNLGGEAKAQYKNAICLVLDENHIYTYEGEDISSTFLITSEPHSKRNPGFPLDSLSIDLESKEYYLDLNTPDNIKDTVDIEEGFRKFFIKNILERKPVLHDGGKR